MPTDCVFSMNCQQSHDTAINKLTSTYRRNRSEDFDITAWCTQESGTKLHGNDKFAQALATNCAIAAGYFDDACSLIIHTAQRPQAYREIDIKAGLNANRPAQLVRLRSGLLLVNVHLTSGNANRASAELALIIALLDSNGDFTRMPTLIIGDFNHTPAAAGWTVLAGPPHQGGHVLDFAVLRNFTAAQLHSLPNYFASDHAAYLVEVAH